LVARVSSRSLPRVPDRWRVLPLGEWVSQGNGSLRLPLRIRCRDCGEPGQLQVRPPMPQFQGATWIATSDA